MSKLLSDILQAPEPEFSLRLRELEKIAGKPGIDLRLVSEMIISRQKILNKLKLDYNDSNAKELYHSLRHRALNDSDELAKIIGISDEAAPAEMLKKCVAFIKSSAAHQKVWTIKSSVIKKHLSENPPKKTLKAFSLRSVESALKRESLPILIFFAKLIESAKWRNKYVAQAGRLIPSDFDSKKVEIDIISATRRNQLKNAGIKARQILYLCQDYAGIGLLPPQKRFRGDVLYVVNSLLENIRELKQLGLFLKYHSLDDSFSGNFAAIRKHGYQTAARVHSEFGWPARLKSLPQIEMSGDELIGMINDDDLAHYRIHDIAGSESIWQHYYFVLPEQNNFVSANLADVIINAVNGHELEQAYFKNAQAELRHELFGRYMRNERIRNYLSQQKGR